MLPDTSTSQGLRFSRSIDLITLTGLAFFAFGYVSGKAIANLGFGLLLLAFLAQLHTYWRMLWKDPFVRLGLIWMVYILMLATWAQGRFPGTEQFESLLEIWSFAFIPLVALATRGDSRRVLITLLITLAGLMFRMARDLHFDGGPWLRYDAQALGTGRNLAVLFIDVGLLGCTALLMTLVHRPVRFHRTAFAAVLEARRGDRWRRRHAGTVYLVLGLALVVTVLARLPDILAEMIKDAPTRQAIISGQLDAVQIDSTGYRVHMWQLAYARWIEYPLTGLGPSAAHLLATDPQRPFLVVFTQFHNSYVEILLRTGLIGAGFYLAAAWLVGRAAVTTARAGLMPPTLLDFLLVSLGVYVLLSGTNSTMFFQQGWHFLILFGGLAYGYLWSPTDARHTP